MPEFTVPGVASIWTSDLSFLLRYLIISCSSIDCWALSFRLCSEMTVTELVSTLIICSTVSTQPVSFPMDSVRRSSNAPGVASHFCSSVVIAFFTLASTLSCSVRILTKSRCCARSSSCVSFHQVWAYSSIRSIQPVAPWIHSSCSQTTVSSCRTCCKTGPLACSSSCSL